MIIKELNREQRMYIYETHMKKDFPPAELKPLKSIERMFEEGIYITYGLFEQDNLLAYAFFVREKEENSLLLDYYAVVGNSRSRGVGSIFLGMLKEKLAAYEVLLLESEAIEHAADEEELSIRKRRIAFYERNGAVKTAIAAEVFGVTYTIMSIDLQKTPADDEEINRRLIALYKTMFSEKTFKTRTSVWHL